MVEEPGEGGEAASPEDLYAAIGKLSVDDLERLAGVGSRLALGLRGLEGADVLMEAVRRALRGSSTWRRGVPLATFLFGIMRNVAKQWREQKVSAAPRVSVVGHALDGKLGVDVKSGDPDPEQVLLDREADQQAESETRETLRRIDVLFDDDIEVQAVLYGIRRGISASQVQEEFGITQTQYQSARRRMKRKLAEAFFGRCES